MVTQAERLARLESGQDYIKEKMDEFISSADKRYASKLTEKIVYTMAGIMLMAIVGTVVSGVVNALS